MSSCLISLGGVLLSTRDEILSDPTSIPQYVDGYLKKLSVKAAQEVVGFLTQSAVESSSTFPYALSTLNAQVSMFRFFLSTNYNFEIVLPRINIRLNKDNFTSSTDEDDLIKALFTCFDCVSIAKKAAFHTFLSALQGGKSRLDSVVRFAALRQVTALFSGLSDAQCKQLIAILVELHSDIDQDESLAFEVASVVRFLPLQASLYVDLLKPVSSTVSQDQVSPYSL